MDHNSKQPEINYKEKRNCKKHKHMKAKQYGYYTTNVSVKKSEEIKKYLATNENGNT